MRQIHGHDAAFPYEEKNGDGSHYWGTPGMTLRDYFAAKAMQGIIAAAGDCHGEVDFEDKTVAENAYAMADAMLAARKGGV